MERTKDLFMMMREAEVNTNNFLPTKKEIEKSSQNFISDLLENGEIEPIEALSQVLRMRSAIDVVEKELKNSLPEEKFEAFGLKGVYKNGYDKPNYEEDDKYKSLKAELKKREELLKIVLKSDIEVYDNEGIEVPKVSTTPTKGSMTITF